MGHSDPKSEPFVALAVGAHPDDIEFMMAATHDNPFGMRLTTLMIAKKIPDSSTPMSLLALHPNVQFNFYRPALAACRVEMH